MSELNLEFLRNDADEEQGLADAGIETYRDEPYGSTARECGQNSSDASASRPVTIEFDTVQVPANSMPGIDTLRAAIDRCLAKARNSGEEKVVDFFRRAKAMAGGETIPALRIADYNTAGLRGPCKPGNPFHSLVKATGVSNKDSETSGGSFGIGKNAAFAISDLQTVFYSTVYQGDDDEAQFLMQGKSILISHEDDEGIARRNTGYWGEKSFSPISAIDQVPEWLRRSKQGTSVFSMGFRTADGWQLRMVESLIRNFFVAVHREELKFSIDDNRFGVNRGNLADLFRNTEIEATAESTGNHDDFVTARHLYDCITSEEAVERNLEIPDLGKVRIRILLRDGLPKRVVIVRNGMVITDNLQKFGDKFQRFQMYRDFVALVEPADQQGSALLKQMENPKHDGLSAERIPDAQKRERAEIAMKKLAKKVRAVIKDEAYAKPKDVESINELAEFFADESQPEKMQDPGADANPEKIKFQPKPVTRKRKPEPDRKSKGEEGGAGGVGNGTSSGGDGGGVQTGAGTGGSGELGRRAVIGLEELRNHVLTAQRRKVWFTPTRGGLADLEFRAAGIHDTTRLHVGSASVGSVHRGLVRVDLGDGVRQTFEVDLDVDYSGPIEIVAHPVSEEKSNATE